VSSASALHEPAVRRDLIGAVDRDVEARDRTRSRERLDPHTELAGRALGRGWRRHAAQVEPAGGGARAGKGPGRAGTEPDEHSVLDELGRCLGGELLLPADVHRLDPR